VGRYKFNPQIPVIYEAVFLDLGRPREVGPWSWVVADSQYMPFREEAFDLIIASHVLEHLEEPSLFTRGCYASLKGAGLLRVKVPNFLSPNVLLDPSHRQVFNVLSLRRLIRRAGLVPRHPFRSPLGRLVTFVMNLLVNELVVEGVKP